MKIEKEIRCKENKVRDSNNNETNKYKSKSNETIFKDKSLQRSLMFFSEVNISDKRLSSRDEKIIELMMKRYGIFAVIYFNEKSF